MVGMSIQVYRYEYTTGSTRVWSTLVQPPHWLDSSLCTSATTPDLFAIQNSAICILYNAVYSFSTPVQTTYILVLNFRKYIQKGGAPCVFKCLFKLSARDDAKSKWLHLFNFQMCTQSTYVYVFIYLNLYKSMYLKKMQ